MPRNARMLCASCSTRCAGSCGQAARGGCCPTICHRGQPSSNRPSVGCVQALSGGDGPRPAHGHPRASRARRTTQRGGLGQAHRAKQPGERYTSRVRRLQTQKGRKVHVAVDTLGNLLAVAVTPVNEQKREQVGEMATQVQVIMRLRHFVC